VSATPIPLIRRLARAVASRSRRTATRAKVFWRTKRLHGPSRVHLEDDDCGLVTMVKDAEFFIEELLRHHSALGVRHILVIDNGSQDATSEIAARYPNVTILRNTLPVSKYEARIRADLARRVFKGGWLLFVDSDELFDPPGNGANALRRLCGYCNSRGFSAVVCQVLDMFSSLPLSATADIPFSQAIMIFNYYSLEFIEERELHDPSLEFAWFLQQSRCPNPKVRILFGGIRQQNFDEGKTCLTAQRLIRNLPEIGLYAHPHFSTYVTCADVTALIRHYKFTGDFIARETAQVQRNTWGHGEDKARMSKLIDKPDYVISCHNAKIFSGIEDLTENGFLVSSDVFERY
jgi:hypothetical protein